MIVVLVTLAKWLPPALAEVRDGWCSLIRKPTKNARPALRFSLGLMVVAPEAEFFDRRTGPDRRSGADRRQKNVAVAIERRSGTDRRSGERRRLAAAVAA